MVFHSFATQVATLQDHNVCIFMKGKYLCYANNHTESDSLTLI